MNTTDLIINLLSLPKWGPTKVSKYVKECKLNAINCINNLSLKLTQTEIQAFNNNMTSAQQCINECEKYGIRIITILDKDFPYKLYNTSNPVVCLFYKGDISLLNTQCIGIVGTRKVHDEFINPGIKVSDFFAQKGYTIVSGLALGCDTIAHKSAVNNDAKTIAVLPCGLKTIYPKENQQLANDILNKNGLLISEYAPNEKQQHYMFVQRDRIQSLLSDMLIVIDADEKSGTMHAINKSLSDHKPVYALCGNCIPGVKHYLNTENEAQLLELEKLLISNKSSTTDNYQMGLF